MGKTRRADGCRERRADGVCLLLENHNGSCVNYSKQVLSRAATPGRGSPFSSNEEVWHVELIDEAGRLLAEFDLTHEPDALQVRAAAVFLLDPGRFPAALRRHLPELAETVYADLSTDQTS